MLRTALTPRFLGLSALLIAVLVSFGWLGAWQLETARGEAALAAAEQARARPPVDLVGLVEPHAPFTADLAGRQVTASGRYAAEGQVLVPGRLLRGREGLWVVTPFVVEGSGATLPVLRGFVTTPADAGAPPTGPRALAGGLAPGEGPSSAVLPEGQIGSVDLSLLVNTWPGDLYNAFLFLESETPATGAQLTKVPTPLPSTGLDWRNAAYAVQWWVFAAFAVWLYWRMLREEARRPPAEGAPEDAPEDGPEDGSAPGTGVTSSAPPAPVPAGGPGENGRRDHS